MVRLLGSADWLSVTSADTLEMAQICVGSNSGNLVEHSREDDFERSGNGRVVDDEPGLALREFSTEGHGEAEFAQEAAQAVDTLSAGVLPLRADAVQWLDGLLLDGMDGDGLDVVAAMGFE